MLTRSALNLSKNNSHHWPPSPHIIFHHCIHGNQTNSSDAPLASLLLSSQTTFSSHITLSGPWCTIYRVYPVNTIPVVSVSQTPPTPQHLYNNCIRNIVFGSHLHYIYPRKTVLLVSCFTAPPITPPPSTCNTTVSVPRWQAPHYWCPGRTAPPVRGGMCWATRCTRPLRFCPAGAHSNHFWIIKKFHHHRLASLLVHHNH